MPELPAVSPPPFSFFGALLSLLVPSRCAGCGEARRDVGGGGLCLPCRAGLPALDPDACCPHCALPGDGAACRGCRTAPPPVGRAAAVGPWAGALRRVIVAYKFEGWDLLAVPLGARLAACARTSGLSAADALVPIPSTRRRNRQRGYDPSALLAEEAGRRVPLPVRPLLSRVRETVPQSSLPASRRLANVEGAFRASPRAAGRRLLLVDDVVTTGATAFDAARALLVAGAAQVDLLMVARTPDPDDVSFRRVR